MPMHFQILERSFQDCHLESADVYEGLDVELIRKAAAHFGFYFKEVISYFITSFRSPSRLIL